MRIIRQPLLACQAARCSSALRDYRLGQFHGHHWAMNPHAGGVFNTCVVLVNQHEGGRPTCEVVRGAGGGEQREAPPHTIGGCIQVCQSVTHRRTAGSSAGSTGLREPAQGAG